MAQGIRRTTRNRSPVIKLPKVTRPTRIDYSETEAPEDRVFDPDQEDDESWHNRRNKEDKIRKSAVWFTSPDALLSANIDPTAEIEGGTIIGDNVTIEPHVRVLTSEGALNTSLSDGSNIGKKSHIIGSVIGKNAIVGRSSLLNHAQVGDDVHSDGHLTANNGIIGKGSKLKPFVTLAYRAEVPDESEVPHNTTIINPGGNAYNPHSE